MNEAIALFLAILIVVSIALWLLSTWHKHRREKIDKKLNRRANFDYEKNNKLTRETFKGLI